MNLDTSCTALSHSQLDERLLRRSCPPNEYVMSNTFTEKGSLLAHWCLQWRICFSQINRYMSLLWMGRVAWFAHMHEALSHAHEWIMPFQNASTESFILDVNEDFTQTCLRISTFPLRIEICDCPIMAIRSTSTSYHLKSSFLSAFVQPATENPIIHLPIIFSSILSWHLINGKVVLLPSFPLLLQIVLFRTIFHTTSVIPFVIPPTILQGRGLIAQHSTRDIIRCSTRNVTRCSTALVWRLLPLDVALLPLPLLCLLRSTGCHTHWSQSWRRIRTQRYRASFLAEFICHFLGHKSKSQGGTSTRQNIFITAVPSSWAYEKKVVTASANSERKRNKQERENIYKGKIYWAHRGNGVTAHTCSWFIRKNVYDYHMPLRHHVKIVLFLQTYTANRHWKWQVLKD